MNRTDEYALATFSAALRPEMRTASTVTEFLSSTSACQDMTIMNPRLIVSSALASVLALGLLSPVAAQDSEDKVKCYGIAKAGQNHCPNLSGTHSCAGQSKVDNDPTEWKFVAKGTCKEMKGMTEAEAKAKTGQKG
jgi:uncharacterized membrane protein